MWASETNDPKEKARRLRLNIKPIICLTEQEKFDFNIYNRQEKLDWCDEYIEQYQLEKNTPKAEFWKKVRSFVELW